MKITKRMILAWGLSTIAGLVIVAGIISVIMAFNDVTYGLTIDYDNIRAVKYVNTANSAELTTESLARYEKPIKEILRMLNEAGKTNKFAQNFYQDGSNAPGTAAKNNTSYNSEYLLANANKEGYIRIDFKTPQYGIVEDGLDVRVRGGEFVNESNQIWTIFIPLATVTDSFTEQTWLFIVKERSTTYLSHKYVTYGNYYELAEYVKELKVK